MWLWMASTPSMGLSASKSLKKGNVISTLSQHMSSAVAEKEVGMVSPPSVSSESAALSAANPGYFHWSLRPSLGRGRNPESCGGLQLEWPEGCLAAIKFQHSSLTKDEDRQIKQLLRQMMRQRYNTKTADDFILYTPVLAEDVALCNGGIQGPAINEYRLDFSEGYRSSRGNEIVTRKLVARALVVLECLDLPLVSEEYLEGEIHRQVIRAHDAWALHQPHFMKESNRMEMQEEAHAQAHGFQNKHGESVLHQTQKQGKFDKREKMITEVVELKVLNVVADLATWKHLSEILCYLGVEGMSSSEEDCAVVGEAIIRTYIIKLSVWRTPEIADYMRIVDKAAECMRINKGVNPASRCVTGLEGKAPKGLPECMYNPEWLAKQKESRPLYYDSLKVSKEAFSLLVAATSRMETD
ncbi:hypothetical protein B0H10DRAFT_1954960 [Mycena sp. CBHHK59/15]|nr:hypothetical protein B0H10DRAFT_1954960 [Mycena sp. CBHHK59/15]